MLHQPMALAGGRGRGGGARALTILVKDLGTSLEPDWLLEGDTVSGQQLRGDASQSTKHGPPGVDHLNLPVPVLTKQAA